MEDERAEPVPQTDGPRHASGERIVYVMPSDFMIAPADDGGGFFELCAALWRSKWLIVGITALFTLAGVAYAFHATEWYRAEVLLAPADKKTVPDLLGSLGGLASLAGISVGGGGTTEPIAVLKSRDFASEFIKDLDLTVILLADKWNARTKQWKAKNPQDWPDIRDAVKYFDENVRGVAVDRRTGLVTLTILWTDPETAALWANQLVRRLNDRMRDRALTEAERNVRYLQSEMIATNVVSLQQSIGRVLESEMQKLMLARGSEEFSLRVIDPAKPPKLRSEPKRAQIILVAFMLGGIVSSAGVLFRRSLRNRHGTVSN
jgi:uncharacterized protein involved in exopolysaccharide biosynthesis